MLKVCIDYLENKGKVKDIYFCLWDKSTYDEFLETLNELT
jgi:hypothetical protein